MAILNRCRFVLTILAVLAIFGSLLSVAYILRQEHLQSERERDLIRRNTTALIALCALRLDLDIRIAGGKLFLLRHPQGVAGISPADLRRSINNSRRTRRTLSILDCKETR